MALSQLQLNDKSKGIQLHFNHGTKEALGQGPLVKRLRTVPGTQYRLSMCVTMNNEVSLV